MTPRTMQAERPLRVFYGVGLDAPARQAAQALQSALQRDGVQARWVAAEALHLTLRFLGATAPARLDALRSLLVAVAAAHPAHVLHATRVARWGRLLVAEFAPAAPTTALAAALEHGARMLDFAPETRAYRPHLTLARHVDQRSIRQPSERRGDELRDARPLQLAVDHIALYESITEPDAARYRVLQHAPLRLRDPA